MIVGMSLGIIAMVRVGQTIERIGGKILDKLEDIEKSADATSDAVRELAPSSDDDEPG